MDRPVISVINGPNLNLLGLREPEIYGHDTLAEVESRCATAADALGFEVDCFQSNHEGAIIDEIHRMRTSAAGFVVNLGAYTHTSIAIRDALVTVSGPFVEVHISNVHARESFRGHSHVSDLAHGVIVGCGVQGYDFAIARIADLVNHR